MKVSFSFSGKICKNHADCINLRDCEPYLHLVKSMEKPLHPAIVEFLRSQECGFDQGYPLVCCSDIRFKDVTQKTLNSRKPLNNLCTESSPTSSPMATTTSQNPAMNKPSFNSNNLQNKADALNKAFMSDYFDYGGSFDLMLRIKRHNGDGLLDIEIR